MKTNIRKTGAGAVRRTVLVILLAVSGLWQGCGDDKEDGGDAGTRLSLSPSVLSFAAEGGTQTLVLEADGRWAVESPGDATWISLSVDRGSSSARIAVTAARYVGTADRRAVLTVKSDDGTRTETVRVEQTKSQADRPDAAGTANCYMAAPGSTQLIEAACRGNSRTEKVGRWATAELLWQDEKGLIRTVEYDSTLQTILFTTAPKSGNDS
ncbi:BACON domain-containing protein, partial [uncultured Alistipes sp.]|uniref:BACON domain-containing protein n=1 Tax=uncultured Alistipes sp. TaxID=538949 RepID=UPI0026EC99D4